MKGKHKVRPGKENVWIATFIEFGPHGTRRILVKYKMDNSKVIESRTCSIMINQNT